MVLGEGAGAIVLEELAVAQARGADDLRRSGRPRRPVRWPDRGWWPTAIGRCSNVLRAVLRQSRLANADDVGHLHAHGLSTRDVRCRGSPGDQTRSSPAASKPLPVVGRQELLRQSGGRQRHGRTDRQPAGPATRPAVPDAELRRRPTPMPGGRGDATATPRRATASSISTSRRKARQRRCWCGSQID